MSTLLRVFVDCAEYKGFHVLLLNKEVGSVTRCAVDDWDIVSGMVHDLRYKCQLSYCQLCYCQLRYCQLCYTAFRGSTGLLESCSDL